MTAPGVVLVIPVKRLEAAKSRLEVEPAVRRMIALSLAEHTVRTAVATPQVIRVVVVTRDRTVRRLVRFLGADVCRERRRGGLNAAARRGRRAARRRVPGADVGILVSDLPALTSADLAEVVERYRRDRNPLVVPDHEGTGTTLLLHPGDRWPPVLFGPESLRRHVCVGYRAVTDAPSGVRRDLDRLADQVPTDRDESTTAPEIHGS
ncbi:2-phospho-L-lactate guanylyltransferase [Nocardioides phosphati]|uniref:2-phospho-L-lactate guanylyltransferase n=1 Tax=Nocardioides phosphati TaxID=1867775 RepID=A0ABQ2NF74_9ACTN|nr:2-phospho-L-lactate guanylyltransferase [Nocardioides phosphati]GGO93988.1 2-phospho-L-lactate guanylyltransferase [Nocardioides phosphati]